MAHPDRFSCVVVGSRSLPSECAEILPGGSHEIRGDGRTFFFLVAGMFGNLLNLRHRAAPVGSDRPFYAIQALGLRGDEDPHRRFEDMAAAYIEEIRAVQEVPGDHDGTVLGPKVREGIEVQTRAPA
jgi:hypothetical protein